MRREGGRSERDERGGRKGERWKEGEGELRGQRGKDNSKRGWE